MSPSFHLGDRYLVNKLECEIIFINSDFAWLAPVEDEGHNLKGIAIGKINKRLRLPDGTKVHPIHRNSGCGAV